MRLRSITLGDAYLGYDFFHVSRISHEYAHNITVHFLECFSVITVAGPEMKSTAKLIFTVLNSIIIFLMSTGEIANVRPALFVSFSLS